jgi:uncharacterized membrane protein
MSLRISEIKRNAKQSLKGNWGLVVLLTFVLFLINAVLPTIIEIAMSGGFSGWINHEPKGASIVNTLITIILVPLTFSVYWFYLSLIRKGNPPISQVFTIYKDGKQLLKIYGVTILQAIFVLLWSLLLIIPGIIKSLSYSQTYFLLRDHPEYTVIQAISESKKRMKGYKWKYFLLGLSFIGWSILCIFTLGIGLLWLIPYMTTSIATFYNEFIYPQCMESESRAVKLI